MVNKTNDNGLFYSVGFQTLYSLSESLVTISDALVTISDAPATLSDAPATHSDALVTITDALLCLSDRDCAKNCVNGNKRLLGLFNKLCQKR